MIHTQQRIWTETDGWSTPAAALPGKPQLVFMFGDRALISRPDVFHQAKQFYPHAYLVVSSTAGNILGTKVSTNTVTLTALYFEKTHIWFSETVIENQFDSHNVGKKLAEFLPTEDLKHTVVLSEGLEINGSALVDSINQYLPEGVTVTGGLAGDGEAFEQTLVGCNVLPQPKRAVLIGFYGSALRVGYASKGGWVAGNEAYTITKSKENILYELNGRPALDVYTELLGPKADQLPSAGLLFPLQIILPEEGQVVRTILGIDESAKSITFAGDMPEGLVAHIMHASENDLIESARQAGVESSAALQPLKPQFALLVSCVGRHLVLKDRIEEEVAAVQQSLGEQATLHGFYSYGELCPETGSQKCLLHNQTMTITTFTEE